MLAPSASGVSEPLDLRLTPDAIATAAWRAGVPDGDGRPLSTQLRDLRSVRPEVVIGSAVDGEPLAATRLAVLLHRTRAVVTGLRAAAIATGASRLVIAVPRARGATSAAREILTRVQAGWRDVRLSEVDAFYPAGDPLVLADLLGERLAGALGEPEPAPGEIRWRKSGSAGATVFGVEVLAALADALRGVPTLRRLVSVAGAVRKPGIYDAPVGTPLGELAEAAGSIGPEGSMALVLGGAVTGRIASPSKGLDKQSSSLIVLPHGHASLRRRRAPISFDLRVAQTVCTGCRRCTELCPRWLVGDRVEPHRFAEPIRVSEHTRLGVCSGCRVCEVVACAHGLRPHARLRDRAGERVDSISIRPARSAHPLRVARRIPDAVIRGRLSLDFLPDPDPEARPTRLHPAELRLALGTMNGAARPVVRGGRVEAGEVLAEAFPGCRAVRVHAPYGGMLAPIRDATLILRSEPARHRRKAQDRSR